MPLTNFPQGVSAYGMPVLGTGIPPTTGNVFYVDSGSLTGAAANAGTDPNAPLLTIDSAVGKCTASNGDIVIVMPGHAENISSATSLVVDVAGIQIIGMGHGRNRPTLTWTATAGTIEMDAAETRLSNIVLFTSISAVTVGINIDADGVTVDNCEFGFDATGDDWVTMLDVDAVNRFTFYNNVINGELTTGWAEAIRLDDCDDVVIAANQIMGQWTDAVIVGEGALGNRLRISHNFLYNADTTVANSIDLNVAFTGLIAYNGIGHLYTTDPEGGLDPGSCLSLENYVCNNTDESGVLVPTATST